MKVWQLMSGIKIRSERNERVELRVETNVIQVVYGSIYDGQLIRFAGISGRVSDIPAYLGGEDVIRYEHRDDCHYITI